MAKRMGEGGLDITPLKNLILEVVDEEKNTKFPQRIVYKNL